jgi:hypothetical protein
LLFTTEHFPTESTISPLARFAYGDGTGLLAVTMSVSLSHNILFLLALCAAYRWLQGTRQVAADAL